MLDADLLKILVCPKTRSGLVFHDGKLYSTNRGTRLVYPIVDGIPMMLVDRAETISEEEFDRIMKAHDGSDASGKKK